MQNTILDIRYTKWQTVDIHNYLVSGRAIDTRTETFSINSQFNLLPGLKIRDQLENFLDLV